ncbi:MAG: hypothetical protein RMI45_00600 [Ignisphaera sp.]|nr:hypothetical protein [Ignisphaera sp.]MDW8084725.1 hypothetical protein [Ignisphaera sp.]
MNHISNTHQEESGGLRAVMIDTAVLGCGWTGILLSNKYAKFSSVLCIDGAEKLGGLLRTEVVDGFTIDVGGSHVIFSRDRGVLDKMLNFLSGNVVEHERKSYVQLNGVFIPYPFENGLYVLPPEERAEALASLIEALLSLDKSWMPKNLEEWIYGFFGSYIAKRYLIPYNRKIWKRPLDEIDVDWVYTPGRLPIPNWRDVVRSAIGIPTQGYLEQAKFYYPLKGGIQALYSAVYERVANEGVALVKNNRVESIKITLDGFLINEKIRAKRILNTIPLPSLIESLSGSIYDDLKQYVRDFDYNSLITVAVALDKSAPPHHWIYVPNEDVIFHRYSWLNNYSVYNTPSGKSLILAEITIPPSKSVDIASISEKTVLDLERLGVVEGEDVIFVKAWMYEYAYPIHRIGLNSVRKYVLDYLLKKVGIASLGRWGSWRYMNTDAIVREVERLNYKHIGE